MTVSKGATPEIITEEIIRISKQYCIPIDNISIRVFSRFSDYGTTYLVQKTKGAFISSREKAKSIIASSEEYTPVEVLPNNHYVKGVSSLVNSDGEVKQQWIKTNKEIETREKILERLLVELPEKIPTRKGKVKKPDLSEDDRLAVYPLGDPHLGMLSWGKETGGSNNSLEIGSKLLRRAIKELVIQSPKTSKALICNLGDFIHSDNYESRTSRSGNALDVDARWSKVIRVGFDVMIHLIDSALKYHNEVYVINEIGNHDDRSSIMLTVGLDKYYSNEPRVNFDLSPSRFHYYKFGRNLIGVTHGHNVKHGELESIMSHDRPEDWGVTDAQNRYWYCGHIHHIRKREFRGCIVESFRTLAPLDSWSAEHGYRSGRDLNRIVLHKNYGEECRSIVSAKYLEDLYKNESK